MKLLVLVTVTLVGFLQLRLTTAQNFEDAIITGKYVIEQDETGLLKDLGLRASGDDRFTVEYKKEGDVWRSEQSDSGKILEHTFKFGEEIYETTLTGRKCKSTRTLMGPIIYEIIENRCDNAPRNMKRVGFDGKRMTVTVGLGTPSTRTIVLRKQ